MYWDVVEVKPEADCRLFVRFKDGLAGHLQLRREELTGALAPLLDAQFFEQVFIDDGAVAWPGAIDLAPDAMYAEVTFRGKLPRFYELKDLLTDPSHPDAYFQNFEDRLKYPSCLETFTLWETELQGLDPEAWEFLKSKALRYLQRRDKRGRGWQQLFDALGEAFAYNYLRESSNGSTPRFIQESNDQTPDLEVSLDNTLLLCEVKTINISDKAVKRRLNPPVSHKVTGLLQEEFFCKLDLDIASAKKQLHSYGQESAARYLVYIKIYFDDSIGESNGIYTENYLQQIGEHLQNHPPGIKVVVNVGPSNKWTHVVAQQ